MSLTTFYKSQLYTRKSNNLINIGFNFDAPDHSLEYFKIQSLLVTEYNINCESMLTIMKKFNIPSSRTMDILFREFDIEARSLSEAKTLALVEGRSEVASCTKYVHIWHTTWDDKSVLLRSSYEVNYAKTLDDDKIVYEVECMRIKYFDTQLQKYRIAIPDFYLPDSNTIVEIKATYWLDVENMKSKKQEYQRLGFNFKLIVDGIETTI